MARVTGLTPGTHGFHVHEFGDCSAADFTSAGGHFNPMAQPHGAPQAAARHVGDLGNIEAGADGVATLDWTDTQLAFEGMHGIVGRAVIVHAKADDLKTQPTGDAGGRLACAVIGVAKPSLLKMGGTSGGGSHAPRSPPDPPRAPLAARAPPSYCRSPERSRTDADRYVPQPSPPGWPAEGAADPPRASRCDRPPP